MSKGTSPLASARLSYTSLKSNDFFRLFSMSVRGVGQRGEELLGKRHAHVIKMEAEQTVAEALQGSQTGHGIRMTFNYFLEFECLDQQLDQLADYLTVMESRSDQLAQNARQLLLEVREARKNGTDGQCGAQSTEAKSDS